MKPVATPTALEQPLPPDAIVGMTWGPFRYRRYPVFSGRWLQWRTMLAAVLIVLYGALAGLAQVAAGTGLADALTGTGYFIVGCLLMVTAGPALATWVRHRRWPARAESSAVIAAVVLGFVGAALADYWSSKGITEAIRPKEIPAAERKIGELDEAKIRLFDLLGGFLYFAVGGGLASFAYFSERRRLHARAAYLAQLDSEMRLAVLQAQVEPHFLFNTLASIRPLIRQDASQAEAALDALADHLRATIPQMREQSRTVVSTLGQQLAIGTSYLAVMQVRMGSRLQHHVSVPDELRSQGFPPLILLSLVENAIKHGIEPKPGPGHLTITAAITGDELTVTVADDGLGLQEGLSSGLGLSNIREQLSVRYGAAARLKVAARAEGGTVAQVTLPSRPPEA
ncbi:MAG: sensor histidine kinase [Roseimicrobium sp.]